MQDDMHRSKSLVIETERLYLLAQTKDMAIAAFTDKERFAKLVDADVPKEWPHDMLKDAEPYFADNLTKDPDSVGWWGWYILLKAPKSILIGSLGFLGRPSSEGTIVTGYSILTEFERRGYMTEALTALMVWAFNQDKVNCIAAETFPNNLASIRVLEKCGLEWVGNGSEKGTIRYEKKIRYS